MSSIFSLFAITVYAAESMLSPVPDAVLETFGTNKLPVVIEKPGKSFADITGSPEATGSSVLGLSIEAPTPSPSPSLTPTPTTKPIVAKPTPVSAKKGTVTIALLGDSMVDTLGPDAPHLKDMLKAAYPNMQVVVKNYGVGATNIEYGITRITNGYTYLGNSIPSLASSKPDIVVLESFGYNPFSFDEGAIDKHWTSLATAVDTLRNTIPGVKVIIAATIAPNATVFGDGAPGLSFDQTAKNQKVNTIKKYLENAVRFARSQHLPLADAYHASLDGSGNGKLTYINPGDHIHYSDAGRVLFGRKVADAITANKLLE